MYIPRFTNIKPPMVSFSEASIAQLSIHKTGNKELDEPLTLSEHALPAADEILGKLLMQYFVHPFEKTTEIYRLTHATDDLKLNEIFHFTSMMFANHRALKILKLSYSVEIMHAKVRWNPLLVANKVQ